MAKVIPFDEDIFGNFGVNYRPNSSFHRCSTIGCAILHSQICFLTPIPESSVLNEYYSSVVALEGGSADPPKNLGRGFEENIISGPHCMYNTIYIRIRARMLGCSLYSHPQLGPLGLAWRPPQR